MPKSPIEPTAAGQVDATPYASERQVIPTLIRQVVLSSLTTLAWLAVFNLSQTFALTKPEQSEKLNFSGSWTLDLEASTSLEPLMNQIGASLLDRKYAAQTRLKVTLRQTEDVVMVATRGPGFSLDQTLYLDGRNDPRNLQLLGATSLDVKTVWSDDDKQLVETHQAKTKQGKDGQLTIKRYLIDEGKTLVVAFNLKLNAEPNLRPPNLAQARFRNRFLTQGLTPPR